MAGAKSSQSSEGYAGLSASPRPVGVRRVTLAAALLLIGLGFGVYGNALRNPFIIDDTVVILGDPRIQQGQYAELIVGRYWPPPRKEMLYRPLVKVTYALNWAVSHEPWAFRLPNLLMHIAASLVVFLLARDLFRSNWSAIVAAAVFVVHPIHTEPLNAVVGRADVGVTLFGLLAVWLYWRDGAASARVGWARPVLAGVCFAGAALCKENALTLVGVVVLLDVARPKLERSPRSGRWLRRRVLRCYAPLLLITVTYLAVRGAVLSGLARGADRIGVQDNVIAHPDHGLEAGDSAWLARWGTPVATFGKAAALMVRPHPLCWDYSYAAIESVKRFTDRRLLFGLGCGVGLLAILTVSYRRRRVAFAALGTALVTYSITSNTLVLIGTVFAERLLYLPSVGFCLLVGGVLGTTIEQGRRATGVGPRASAIVAALTVVAGGGWYGWLTIDRNRDWRSDETLNAADVKTNPGSSRLQSAVASNALRRGNFDTALARAERAIAIYPQNPSAWRVAGFVYRQRGDRDRALECLARSFAFGGAGNESAMVAATGILVSRGQYREAIRLLEDFVAKYPLAAGPCNNLAWYLLTAEPPELRDPAAALAHARSAVTLRPNQAAFIDTFVSALLALGRQDEAIRLLRRSLPEVPKDDPLYPALSAKLKTLEGL